MKANYRAILFHPEGDFVSDFNRDTKEDVWSEINDMGSRWIFYPIPFVATDKTIIDTLPELYFLKGKRIKTVAKMLNKQWIKNPDLVCQIINDGLPLDFIFD